MSIQKRPNDKYRARYRDLDGREHSRHFDRKGDAELWLADQRVKLARGDWLDPAAGLVTVEAWAKEWLPSQVQLKPSTYRRYESLLSTHIVKKWAKTPLSRLSPSSLQTWVADLSKKLSASSVRQAVIVLSRMLDVAVRDGRIRSNPAKGLELPRLVSKPRRYLTHAQVRALAEGIGHHKPLILLLAYSGIRWGEAMALTAADVDTLRCRLSITASTTEVSGKAVRGTPKSGKGREVTVPRFVIEAMSPLLTGGPVFHAPRGGPISYSNFRRDFFTPAATAIGSEGLTPHELRHTAASLAISAGASPVAVAKMLGHADPSITLKVYTHLFADDLDDVAARMGAAAADSMRTARAGKSAG